MSDHNGRYILDGHTPVPAPDLETWARWYQNPENFIVAKDTAPDGAQVSTVFLALDHNFFGVAGGQPILFETMVFGGPLNGEQVRYATWDEAVAGHAEMLARAIAASGPS